MSNPLPLMSCTTSYVPMSCSLLRFWPLNSTIWCFVWYATQSTTLARQPFNANDSVAYQACALAIRDELIRRWNVTTSYQTRIAPKRAYYFSLEYLMVSRMPTYFLRGTTVLIRKQLDDLQGRTLDNAVLNLDMKDMVAETMGKLGFNFEDLLDEERDAGLGNGGLGRLAACYLDSATTLDLPVWGYGLRYDYGIFKQLIDENGESDSRHRMCRMSTDSEGSLIRSTGRSARSMAGRTQPFRDPSKRCQFRDRGYALG